MLQTANAGGCKAVLIDGASSLHIKHSIGVEYLNCKALYRILVHEIGTARKLAFPPLVTMAPGQSSGGNGLEKQLAGAGFNVAVISSTDSADDKVIKNRIAAIDPRLVSEIVIMSTDKDYVPELRVMAGHGVKIHWAATMHPRPGTTRHGFSNDVLSLFDSGEFHFTELAGYASRIAKQALGSKANIPCCSDQSFTEISLKLRNRDKHEHIRLVNEIQRLINSFKGLSMSIEN